MVSLPRQITARYFFTRAVFAAELSSSVWKTPNGLGEHLHFFKYFNPSVTRQRTNTDKQDNLFVSGFHCWQMIRMSLF